MKTEHLSEIGVRILEVCRSKELNQSELAQILGVSSTAIYKIVSGATTSPSMDLILGFYQKLGVDVIWLATGAGSMDAATPTLPHKSADGGAFGDSVLERVVADLDNLKRIFEEEIRIKNQQIAGLQRTVDVLVGKSEGAIERPLSTPLSFEETMRQYRQTVMGQMPKSALFLVPLVAKPVAPRSFV